MSDNPSFPPSPFAKYPGELMLGDTSVDCYVLDTKERVISLRATVKSIANVEAGNLGDYIGAQALKSYINKDLILGELIEFHIPGTQLKGKGIAAEKFLVRRFQHIHVPLRERVGLFQVAVPCHQN